MRPPREEAFWPTKITRAFAILELFIDNTPCIDAYQSECAFGCGAERSFYIFF